MERSRVQSSLAAPVFRSSLISEAPAGRPVAADGRFAAAGGFRGGAFGNDTIRDFQKGEDKIAFAGGPSHAGEIAFVATGTGIKLVYGGASILLEGAAGIDAGDLLFAVDFAGLSPRAYQDLV